MLISFRHVLAMQFATVALTRDYWKKRRVI